MLKFGISAAYIIKLGLLRQSVLKVL